MTTATASAASKSATASIVTTATAPVYTKHGDKVAQIKQLKSLLEKKKESAPVAPPQYATAATLEYETEITEIEPAKLTCLCIQNRKADQFWMVKEDITHKSIWQLPGQPCTCKSDNPLKKHVKYFLPAYASIQSVPKSATKIHILLANGTQYKDQLTPQLQAQLDTIIQENKKNAHQSGSALFETPVYLQRQPWTCDFWKVSKEEEELYQKYKSVEIIKMPVALSHHAGFFECEIDIAEPDQTIKIRKCLPKFEMGGRYPFVKLDENDMY